MVRVSLCWGCAVLDDTKPDEDQCLLGCNVVVENRGTSVSKSLL